uniref:Uncharacterized protein n=1 Tax=Cacopsylla melanoneura TaxID=428564 RepID=A0A8D8YQG8_9HEMI
MWEYSPKVGFVFLGGIFPTGGNLIIYWEIYSLIIVGILFLGGIFPTSGNLFIYSGNILLNSGNLFLCGGIYFPKVEFFFGRGGNIPQKWEFSSLGNIPPAHHWS